MLLKKIVSLFALGFLFLAAARADDAKPFLHSLFSDGAVLQRDAQVPVWGWATPGEKITVEFGGQRKTAAAGADGKWMAKLDAMKASAEPRELHISSSSSTHQPLTISNILVGDVWICSGQSNMEMGIGNCNAPGEIASANFPQIRLLTIQKAVKYEPIETTPCKWLECSPQTVAANGWGGFSAAGFFFGRELYKSLNIPIGLIHSSWGGTICEAWASADGLAPLADFKDRLESVQKTAASKRAGKSDDTGEAWYAKNDPGTRDGWAKPDADDSSWKNADVSKPWEQNGLPDYDGLGWYRKSFDAPAEWAGKDLTLSLGAIDDADTTFFNGAIVGSKDVWNAERVYKIPGKLVKAGRNVIAVRVLDNQGNGGMYGNTALLHVSLAGNPQSDIALVEGWKLKDSAPLAKLNGRPTGTDDNNPNVSTVLFNGMIAPLLPFAIKGAIWYQGESNGGRGKQYRQLLESMIQDWRTHFGVGDFPFYIVSLANFQQSKTEPGDDAWAELRESQMRTAAEWPNCGLALAIDIGDAADIHPKNKMEVGRRLALAALAQTYGQKIEFSGPWYRDMKTEDGKIRLTFDHADGLAAKGDKLTGFAIAGEDKKFVWADAKIEGKTVIVSSDKIAKPVAVRYAWESNPVCNLYNAAGLPAVPFRTDTWPGVSDNNK